ncbi:hypothetical protein CSX04_05019 [Burkholderia cepacia]|nr:hypothetical protein CSX04_05019 [Burkholderia cepacia]
MKLEGLSRQIALTMAGMAFGVTLLMVLTAYVFYYFAFNYWPAHFDTKNLLPTAPEWVWLVSTTSVGLALSVAVAVNLARRILVPLNSVTDSIRRVARGDLARAPSRATARCTKPRCSPTTSTRSPASCSA